MTKAALGGPQLTMSESLAQRHPADNFWVNLLLWSALGLLVVGVLAPIVTFKTFVFFKNTVSVITGLYGLVLEGHWALFVIIGLFSVLLPIAKLVFLHRLWHGGFHNNASYRRCLSLLEHYGKWSMLDVFVVAVLVVTLKLGAIGDVQVHYGLHAFAASVLLTMGVTARVGQLARRDHAP